MPECENLGHVSCCYHILTCYGHINEGYDYYGFCFDYNEEHPPRKLDLSRFLFKKFLLLVFKVFSLP